VPEQEWIAQFTGHLGERLAAESATAGRKLAVSAGPQGGYIGTRDRWLVQVALAGRTFVIRTRPPDGGPWVDHRIDGLADLESHWAAILESVRAWIDRLTPHRLEPGRRYRVVRVFADYYGNEFVPGQELIFRGLDYLPYDNGYTLRFEERGMWIQGGSEIFEDFGLNVVAASGPDDQGATT
jgi:hypothetical protein